MEPICDYCGALRATVYCRSHSAKLCLHCDNYIHDTTSFNHHDRSLICDRCNSQPATFRCVIDEISLCICCAWNGNGCSSPGHHYLKLIFYHGCPSMFEFSSIWACVLDSSTIMKKMNHDHNNNIHLVNTVCGGGGDDDHDHVENEEKQMINRSNEKAIRDELEQLITPYSNSGYIMPCNRTQVNVSPNLMDHGVVNELEDVNDLKIIPAEGVGSYNIEDGIRDLVAYGENLSLTESNSIEESSTVQGEGGVGFQSAWSQQQPMSSSSSNSFLMNPTWDKNLNIGFPNGGQVLSASTVTRESSSSDYQDCGLSPAFLNGEPLWEPNVEVSFPQARNEAKMRYNEKKKKRMFGKQIRYASRKARADTRKRVKGRFVKAGEVVDAFDPHETKGFC